MLHHTLLTWPIDAILFVFGISGAQLPNNGVVTSPNYPHMYERVASPPQHISVSDGDYLILWLDDLDLPPPFAQPDVPLNASTIMTSCQDYIRVYEVDAEQKSHDMALLCGSINQFHPQSHYIVSEFGKDVYIELNITLHTLNNTGPGFQIMYTAGYLACSHFREVDVNAQGTGMVASQQFPHNKCSYTYMIFDSLGQDLYLEITLLYYEGGTCAGTFLQILHAFICGGHPDDFHKTVITLKRDLIHLRKGNFILTFKVVASLTHDVFTGNYFELDYDTKEEGATCEWKIQGPQGTLLVITIGVFQQYQPSPDYCTYHGAYFMDGSGVMLFYHCPDTNKLTEGSEITALSNVMYVRVHNVSQKAYVNFVGAIAYYTNSLTTEADRPEPTVEFKCYDPLATSTRNCNLSTTESHNSKHLS